jgi:hypothetical protein
MYSSYYLVEQSVEHGSRFNVFNDLRLKSEAIAVLLPAEYRLAKKLGVEFTGGIIAFANSDEVLYSTLIGANIIIPTILTK